MHPSDIRTPVIIVLGQGEADQVSESAKIRIRTAIQYAIQLSTSMELRKNDLRTPVLVFGAGVGRAPSDLTLGERMGKYASQVRDEMELPQSTFHIVSNTLEREVWGTRMEAGWAFYNSGVEGAQKTFFVTNPVHARRAALIAKNYRIDHEIVASDDPCLSYVHEVLAYLKLAWIRCFGDRFIEQLRRKHWRSG